MLNLTILLPFYDVARLAEGISVLDHISAGRATYVFGIGYRAEEFGHFGLSLSDRGRTADHWVISVGEPARVGRQSRRPARSCRW